MNSSTDANDLCYGLATVVLSLLLIVVAYDLCKGYLIWEIIRHS